MRSFFGELKRRNVLRAGALYVGGAWALSQGLAQLLPVFDIPNWVTRWFVIAVMIGFPFAMFFSWYYEWTPEGIKRESDVEPSASIVRATGKKLDRWIIVTLALAVVLLLADKLVLHKDAAGVSDTSIAVLPFLNMSGDPKQDYFSDGMTEEILNALANVPKLDVTARTSVFSLKGQSHDVREIGKMLGVAYVLEGSVRQAEDEVRVTAQLIRTDSGFHLWSQTYDRKLLHIFALQAEVAGDIAQALKLPLGIGGNAALVAQRTDDPQAYALYLQAREAYRARGPAIQRSIDLYHAALARDPKFAPAWAGLCGSLNVLPYYLPENRKGEIPQTLRDAEAACNRAIELAPDLASPHIMLGNLYTNEWRWALAEQHFHRAQVLAPSDPEFYFSYTDWLGAQGRIEEALQAAQHAVALDPLAPMYRNLYGYLLSYSGRNDECIVQMQAGFALAPGNIYLNQNLFICYLETGRFDDAQRQRNSYRDALVANGEDSAVIAKEMAIYAGALQIARDPSQYAAISKTLGDRAYITAIMFPEHIDELFALTERSIDIHEDGVDFVVLLRSPLFAKYRDDPRYLRLLKKVGLDTPTTRE